MWALYNSWIRIRRRTYLLRIHVFSLRLHASCTSTTARNTLSNRGNVIHVAVELFSQWFHGSLIVWLIGDKAKNSLVDSPTLWGGARNHSYFTELSQRLLTVFPYALRDSGKDEWHIKIDLKVRWWPYESTAESQYCACWDAMATYLFVLGSSHSDFLHLITLIRSYHKGATFLQTPAQRARHQKLK